MLPERKGFQRLGDGRGALPRRLSDRARDVCERPSRNSRLIPREMLSRVARSLARRTTHQASPRRRGFGTSELSSGRSLVISAGLPRHQSEADSANGREKFRLFPQCYRTILNTQKFPSGRAVGKKIVS